MTEKKRGGLGRGIDAIFSDFEADEINSENVVEINLNEIRPNPYQPRKEFDEASLDELAQSIRENGVFQPIVVRKSVNGYQIVVGERRFRASKIAQRKTIPAIVRDLDESQMMEIGVLENLQREDLNPIEEAQAYQTLIEKLHLTQEQISEKLGKSRPYIANYLRLLTLPPKTKQLLTDSKLTMAQARTLLTFKDPNKIDQVAQMVVDQGLTVRQLEKMVAQPQPKTSKKNTNKKSPFIKETEEQLINKFGTSVRVVDTKGGKGKIQIDFSSTKDLNRILELLNISLN
ncbi:MAG: ParB/RepB/Spo0J family partition protein [Lactobacillus sp.]|uniref:Chromosome partitioning protein ParB n=1 Tax=Bombilactobacillus bombi TaxID=1303590 RepID=A0A3R6XXF8_9LACO|nr:ParB/RepB/Spo0J family partition protein [Bombilactobacillus bombi]MCO6543619.1 ParB/RepB/Spo0J family partition protein [Lactobacillus sp.]RHW48475.1 chromosome partitioning protein ParB [Bombilactobacillus bombi]RHW52215.1 chromosome partitioning protein ParB [Bombilactobacillus bombi]